MKIETLLDEGQVADGGRNGCIIFQVSRDLTGSNQSNHTGHPAMVANRKEG